MDVLDPMRVAESRRDTSSVCWTSPSPAALNRLPLTWCHLDSMFVLFLVVRREHLVGGCGGDAQKPYFSVNEQLSRVNLGGKAATCEFKRSGLDSDSY